MECELTFRGLWTCFFNKLIVQSKEWVTRLKVEEKAASCATMGRNMTSGKIQRNRSRQAKAVKTKSNRGVQQHKY